MDPVAAVAASFRGTAYGSVRELFRGKVVDVERETRRGFALGRVEIARLGREGEGGRLRISFQNENLVAWEGEAVVATVPDLILVLDPETGRAITTERLHYGQRVVVLAVGAPEIMRTAEALRVWGPEAFGYRGMPYRPWDDDLRTGG
jgi:hypothetical protein